MDKYIYNILGFFDDIIAKIDRIFSVKKTKRTKKFCKKCNCKCHCKDGLHLHEDQDLCTCDNCKCK